MKYVWEFAYGCIKCEIQGLKYRSVNFFPKNMSEKRSLEKLQEKHSFYVELKIGNKIGIPNFKITLQFEYEPWEWFIKRHHRRYQRNNY